MHYYAGNDQFTFHACLLAPDTDKSKFTTGFEHYGQLITFVVVTRLESIITQTRPCNIQQYFTAVKMLIFQIIFKNIFLIFAQNIDCGYTLEPQWVGSNEYTQSMF